MRCSNPECRRLTCGPRADSSQTVNLGVAAHITAASEGGPRYDPGLTHVERSSIENGIWLCATHAKLVDNDAEKFTTALLREWKSFSEGATAEEIEGREGAHERRLPPDLVFVTEKVTETKGGFRVQFSLANASPQGQVNVFGVVPVLLFRHYFVQYYEVRPHVLPRTTLDKLHLMQRTNPGDLLESGDGLFSSGNLVRNRVFRLPPHEMDTFTSQFVAVKNPPAVRTIGFLIQFSDTTGKRRVRQSDCVFAFSTEFGFSIAQYDLKKLKRRLLEGGGYSFWDDVVAGDDGELTFSNDPIPQDADGVVRIAFDPDDVTELVEGIPCDWNEMFTKSIEFLQSAGGSWEEMRCR